MVCGGAWELESEVDEDDEWCGRASGLNGFGGEGKGWLRVLLGLRGEVAFFLSPWTWRLLACWREHKLFLRFTLSIDVRFSRGRSGWQYLGLVECFVFHAFWIQNL